MKHGEIYLADLDPTRGAEQAGRRPVLILQNDLVSRLVMFTLGMRGQP